MDQRDTNTPAQTAANSNSSMRRRRRNGGDESGVRFFLPKLGSTAAEPELGEEVASESEALIRSFKGGQVFYTLAAWKAVPEVNDGSPVIVKQAAEQKSV